MTDRTTSSNLTLLISFVLFIAVLGAVFGFQLNKAQKGFDLWVGHEDHRMPNIRLVPDDCRWAVIERFIDLQPVDKADAFIFGDSQMFARGATKDELFYTTWLGQDATVINFAFLMASISDMRKIADELDRRNIKTKTLFHNLNIAHYRIRKYPVGSKEAEQIAEINSIFESKLPDRLGTRQKSRAFCAFKMRKEFSRGTLRTPRYRKLPTKFTPTKLSPHYASFDKEVFFDSVQEHIKSFSDIAENPIFVSAPVAYDKFEFYNFDITKIDDFAQAFQELCREYPDIECYDLTRLITSEGFTDIVHLNAAGYETLGQELKLLTPQ